MVRIETLGWRDKIISGNDWGKTSYFVMGQWLINKTAYPTSFRGGKVVLSSINKQPFSHFTRKY